MASPGNLKRKPLEEVSVGLGASIFLIALGAILAFAVTYELAGLDIQVIGWILLVVGILGLVLSMVFWSSWGGPAYWSRRRTYVDEGPPPL